MSCCWQTTLRRFSQNGVSMNTKRKYQFWSKMKFQRTVELCFWLPKEKEIQRKHTKTGPRNFHTENNHDPVHILRVIKFSRNLKDLATTDVALADAMDVIFDGDDDASSIALQSAPRVPPKANLQRARIRLDAVTMGLEQREMAHYAETPSMVQSMHLFSDASPVTGTEL